MEKKIANKLNFVNVTIVTKTGTVIQGQAKEFLYHSMDSEFVADWLGGGSYVFKIEDIESFMVTR